MRRLTILFIAFLFIQCARQSQPAGGPKDEKPPELISSNPTNGQKKFKGKDITLVFDEYVKLKDPQEEIVITPSAGEKTKFAAKKNKVIITPELPWKDSTTYSISFRGGVQDINESNPADNLRLAFSTGTIIDSLEIIGRVNEFFKEKIPEKITVALYLSDTFDIFKHKPTYLSKTNKKGQFKIQNLKPGKYFIYAFEDKNKNFKVDGKSEKFGFRSNPISIPEEKDSIKINLIQVDNRPIKITSIRNTNTTSTIRFNKPLDSIHLTSEKKIIYTFGSNTSEVVIFKSFNTSDSSKITIHASDSVYQKIDTSAYVKFTDSKKVSEKFKQGDWTTSFNFTSFTMKAQTSFNKLLSKITLDSIYVQLDSSNYQQIKPEDIKFDTLHKSLTIETKLNITLKEKLLHPVLLLGKAAFISYDNDSSKTQEAKIDIPDEKDTGSLSIEIKTDEKNFEVQLLNSKNNIVRKQRNAKKITWNYLAPEEYKLMVIVDSNNNKRWDPGNFYNKKEPEKVIIYINEEGQAKFPVRANWEVGPLVITF
ncbi:MAG TPA: hypothetical protein DGG95_08690 [Cytophagales bacterium]|jgi:uncharacterized protein (DUF2141 family)|nr:hypothetical protein [Cytophagales bacterium]